MKKQLCLASICLGFLFLSFSCKEEVQTVSLSTLLDEMVSAEAVARVPSPYYTTHQVSSYDRRSVHPDSAYWFANNDGFGIVRTDTINNRIENVLFDEEGPGAITRIWLTTINKSGMMRFYFDGATEAQWAIPAYDLMRINIPLGRGLLQPHTSYTPDGKGGNTLFFPIPYAKSCKVTFEYPEAVEPTPKYYQINYRKYPKDVAVETFSAEGAMAIQDKIAEVDKTLLAPPTYKAGKTVSVSEQVSAGQSLSLSELPQGNQAIRNLDIQIDMANKDAYAVVMRCVILQIEFDGKTMVWAPLSDFSAGGVGAPYVDSWYLSADGKGTVTSRWVMPYQKEAKITLINYSDETIEASVNAQVDQWKWDDRSLYFHASWKQEQGIPVTNEYDNDSQCLEWNFATIKGKGVYMGDLLSLYNYSPAWYGEGDEKIWVDDDTFPSHFGTGTEDYYNSSWAPVVPFHTPFGGAPRADKESSAGYNAFFRTRNLDAIPFTESFRFDIEMLSWVKGTVDYATTIYWYGEYDAKAENTSGLEEITGYRLPEYQDKMEER